MTTRYRTIVADPPWQFTWQGSSGGRRRNATTLRYDTMTYVDIAEMPMPPIERNATLFLWTTQEALHEGEARRVATGWGFPKRVGELIWRKPNFGTGDFPRIGHETCLIYKRGDGSLKKTNRPRNVHSVQTWSHLGPEQRWQDPLCEARRLL